MALALREVWLKYMWSYLTNQHKANFGNNNLPYYSSFAFPQEISAPIWFFIL
jgi:hypothetical protein